MVLGPQAGTPIDDPEGLMATPSGSVLEAHQTPGGSLIVARICIPFVAGTTVSGALSMEALVPPDANPFGKRRAEDVLDEQSAHKEQRIEIIHPHHHHHDPSRLVQTGGAPQMVMTTDSMVEEALPLMAGVPQDQAQMAQAQMAQQHVNGMASAMGMDQTLGGGIPNPLIDPNDPAAGGMTLHHPAPEPPQLPSLMRPPPPLPVGRKEGEEVVQVTHKWGEVGDSFKSGKFSKRESELIIAAINDYTTKHDISTDVSHRVGSCSMGCLCDLLS